VGQGADGREGFLMADTKPKAKRLHWTAKHEEQAWRRFCTLAARGETDLAGTLIEDADYWSSTRALFCKALKAAGFDAAKRIRREVRIVDRLATGKWVTETRRYAVTPKGRRLPLSDDHVWQRQSAPECRVVRVIHIGRPR
jgi:hypothetical protein